MTEPHLETSPGKPMETNGEISLRRSSRIKKPKRPWSTTFNSDDEEFEESLFDDDDNKSYDEIDDNSEGSVEEIENLRKKRQTAAVKPKRKPKKSQPMPQQTVGSRRSTRVKSNPCYAEKSDNDDGNDSDLYELCEGQPKISTEKKKTQPLQKEAKVIPNSTPKQKNNTAKKTATKKTVKKKATKKKTAKKQLVNKVSADIQTEKKVVDSKMSNLPYVPIITPDLVKTDSPSSRRVSARHHSHVSYVEDSSDDELDLYELCDGQPVKRQSTDKSTNVNSDNFALISESGKVAVSTEQASNDNEEDIAGTDEKVILVQGQPIAKSKAVSMLDEENQFYVEKRTMHLNGEKLHEPLCIWKLHGKVLEKFAQVECTKTFESEMSCINFEEGELKKNYKPIKAVIYGKNKKNLLAEVVELPVNNVFKKVIERRVAELKKHKKIRRRSLSTGEANKRTKKTVLQDSSVPPRKRRKPRASPSTPSDADEFNNLSIAFPSYLKILLRGCIDRRHLESRVRKNNVVDNKLAFLANKLLDGVVLNEDFAEHLRVLPVIVEDGPASERTCQALKNSEEPAGILVTLSGTRNESVAGNTSKQFAVSEKIWERCRLYSKLHHFKWMMLNECVEKFDNVAKNERNDVTGDESKEIVKEFLDDIINRVAGVHQSVTCDASVSADNEIALQAKKILNDIINRVASVNQSVTCDASVSADDEITLQAKKFLDDVINNVAENMENEAEAVTKTLNDVIGEAEKRLAHAFPLEETDQSLVDVAKSIGVERDAERTIEVCLADSLWVAKMFEDLVEVIVEANKLIGNC